MSASEIGIRLAAGVVLIGLNAFFVAVEFALTRLPSLDLDEGEMEGSRGLRRAMSMTDRLEIHLTGCQLGISTTSVILGVVVEPAMTVLIEPVVGLVGVEGGSVRGISVVVAVVILNLVHKIWGEQAPTYLGVERPKEVAERLAPILWVWSRVMGPIIRMGDSLAKWTLRLFGVEITRSWAKKRAEGEGGDAADGREREEPPVRGRTELKRRMAALLRSSGEMPADRQEEVMQAFEIDVIPARRVMVPARDMVFLALDVPDDDNLRRLARSTYVRYPVLHRDGPDGEGLTPERFAGVIYTPRLFDPPERLRSGDLELEELLAEPVFLSADLSLAHLIDRLQDEGQEAALLTDGDGDAVVGFITITDALETIAGEITDPMDPPPPGAALEPPARSSGGGGR